MKLKILIPIVGIHSSGKNTIRHKLTNLDYTTEEECAELLRQQYHLEAGASADISFEELVKTYEMERDLIRNWETIQYLLKVGIF